MSAATLKWIYSGGGPYILATRNNALAWLGTQGLSAGDGSRFENDYERACESKDYASKIEGSLSDCLVIGDLPDPLTILPTSECEALVVKCLYTDTDEQVQAALKDVDTDSFEDFPFQIEVTESKLFLFDSAWQLADIGDNYLELTLQLGRYAVSALNYEPNDRVSLHLIRLKRIAELAAPAFAAI